MKIPSSILTMLAGILLTLVSLWYGKHHGLMPTAASEDAPLVDDLFDTMMIISTGLFILVQGTIIVAAIKYRRKLGDTSDGPAIEGNIPLEILWTAIPAVIVLGISVYSFEVYNALGGIDPMSHSGMAHHGGSAQAQAVAEASAAPLANPGQSDPSQFHHDHSRGDQGNAIAAPLLSDVGQVTTPAASEATTEATTKVSSLGDGPLEVEVKGLQYAWLFTYPEGFISGELHMPLNRDVVLKISANDVIHAFWVPEYRVKQDAIPGRNTELHFKPTKLGEYPVICAELCGPYHGGMRTRAIAELPEDFATWVTTQSANANVDDLSKAIALQDAQLQDPHTRTPAQFLQPFVQDLGIEPVTLQKLHASAEHTS